LNENEKSLTDANTTPHTIRGSVAYTYAYCVCVCVRARARVLMRLSVCVLDTDVLIETDVTT
jgi:hypothetical protein